MDTPLSEQLPPPPSPDGCAICLEDYYSPTFNNNNNNSSSSSNRDDEQEETTISACVPCGHVFHTRCFARYEESRLGDRLKCPVCQQTVETFTRLYCTLATTYTHEQNNNNNNHIEQPQQSFAAKGGASHDTNATIIHRTNRRRRDRDDQEEKGDFTFDDENTGGINDYFNNNPQLRQARHFKKLYRQSQKETWLWQGKYRQAVETHAVALATERQHTTQAASLIILLQHQLQQAQTAHQDQLQQVLTLALQREEALRQTQGQLQEYQRQQQNHHHHRRGRRHHQEQQQQPSPPSSVLVVSPTPGPSTTNTAAAAAFTSPSLPPSLLSFLPALGGVGSTATILSPHRRSTAAVIQYQQKDTIVQGTAQAYQHQQQQHEEYLMVVHETGSTPEHR